MNLGGKKVKVASVKYLDNGRVSACKDEERVDRVFVDWGLEVDAVGSFTVALIMDDDGRIEGVEPWRIQFNPRDAIAKSEVDTAEVKKEEYGVSGMEDELEKVRFKKHKRWNPEKKKSEEVEAGEATFVGFKAAYIEAGEDDEDIEDSIVAVIQMEDGTVREIDPALIQPINHVDDVTDQCFSCKHRSIPVSEYPCKPCGNEDNFPRWEPIIDVVDEDPGVYLVKPGDFVLGHGRLYRRAEKMDDDVLLGTQSESTALQISVDAGSHLVVLRGDFCDMERVYDKNGELLGCDSIKWPEQS